MCIFIGKCAGVTVGGRGGGMKLGEEREKENVEEKGGERKDEWENYRFRKVGEGLLFSDNCSLHRLTEPD